ARTNTQQSMSTLCERRAYLNGGYSVRARVNLTSHQGSTAAVPVEKWMLQVRRHSAKAEVVIAMARVLVPKSTIVSPPSNKFLTKAFNGFIHSHLAEVFLGPRPGVGYHGRTLRSRWADRP